MRNNWLQLTCDQNVLYNDVNGNLYVMDQHLNFQHMQFLRCNSRDNYYIMHVVGVILCDKRILLERGLPY